MNRRSILIRSVFILLIVLAITGIPGVNAYTTTLRGWDNNAANNSVAVPPFFYSGTCSVSTENIVSASHSGSYSLSSKWWSPYGNQIGFSVPSLTSNLSCYSLGIVNSSTAGPSDFYSSEVTTTSYATTFSGYSKVIYTCDPINDIINLSNSTGTDKKLIHPYSYYFTLSKGSSAKTGVSDATALNLLIDKIRLLTTPCWSSSDSATTDAVKNNDTADAIGLGSAISYWFAPSVMIPFNSMFTGNVNVTVNAWNIDLASTTGTVHDYNIYLYDTVANTTASLGTTLGTYQQTLVPDRDYWLLLWDNMSAATTGAGGATYRSADYSVAIWAYSPAWSCTEWSECNSSIESRVCTDPAGKVPNRIETQACDVISSVTWLNNLGFEDSRDQKASLCQVNSGCAIAVFNITAEYPVNWTVVSTLDNSSVARENYVTMTSEGGSREGTRSLKMWYIPPSMYEPISDGSDGTACGNATTGRYPEVNTPYNNTMFVAANISFPSAFMDLRFSVKRCAGVPIRWDNLPWYCILTPSKSCYGVCNATLYGKYGMRLVDASDSSLIVDVYGDAGTNWADYVVDISDRGLLAGHNYTLAFAVNPENQQDPYSSCVYVDKVQATVRGAAITNCASFCDSNYTRYEAISTDPCIYKAAPSSVCVADSTDADGLDDVINGTKAYVCIGNDAISYDALTGQLVKTLNAPLCVAENAADDAATPTTTDDYFNATLKSVPFMASLLILISMLALPLLISRNGSNVGDMWPLPLFGIAQFIFICSLNGILPIYFAVMEGVIAAAVLAFFISKAVR